VPSGLCGWGLSRFFGVPLVLSALGGDVYDPSKRFSPHKSIILKKIISFLFNHADKNTVESRNLKKIILKNYPIHKQIEVIPLGLTRPDFVKKTRSELTLPDDIIILISVGRLVPRKGYAFALEALANISSPGCHYLVIGDGPEEQSLKNLARQLHVEDMVTFLGFLPDELKFQYLSASDIYVLPSVHEGFGICLLEAMHCGLPIVSTDEGGQTDILTDGRNALLVPPGDSIALSEKIRQLLNDDLLRMNISGNNRTDIGNYYIDEIVKEYENIYIELKNSGK
jgi:glycosyltransferase involved in cell wall biosynthesis